MADLATLRAAALAALRLLDSYGPDEQLEDDDFVAIRSQLRAAVEPESANG